MGTRQTDKTDRQDRQTEREILSRQQRPPTSAKNLTDVHFHCGTENAAQKKNYERAQCSVLSVVQCKCIWQNGNQGPGLLELTNHRVGHVTLTHALTPTDWIEPRVGLFGESGQRRVIWQVPKQASKQAKEVRAGSGRAELNWLRSSSSSSSSNAAA